MKTILLISPYWKEEHRWMVSSVKLAELWQRIGYRVVVLCMGRGKVESDEVESGKCKGESVEKVSEMLEIHRVPDIFIPDPWNYGIAFGFSGKALRLARELKPDIIIVNKVLFWSSLALLRLRLSGFRVLLLTDALVGITWWPRGKLAQVCAAIYARTLGWLILKQASLVVFFHPQPTDTLRSLGIEGKSSVIPTGIDATDFGGAHAKGKNTLTVTYIGRMESVKGVDDFAAAVTAVMRDHPDVCAQAVGWCKPGHPLVREYGDRIAFTGLRHDIPALLAETDIFVLPSYSEGLSNALMEAMASGCACIASDTGGNTFLIENGRTGFLFPPGDREALAAHIRRLVEDPVKRETIGERARVRIHDVFSWEKIGKHYDEYFRRWFP